MNLHCGKHDKIYTAEIPCPGCLTEAQENAKKKLVSAELKGPDDTLAEMRAAEDTKDE